MSTATENDTKAQELYWHKMTQLKFDLYYYSHHFSSCVRTMRLIRIGIAAITTLVTAIWMEWNDVEILKGVCAFVIIGLQVFSACSELLPFDKRKQEIRDLQNLLNPVYDSIEKEWSKISDGQYTKEEIINKAYEYSRKRNDIQQHFVKEDSLPLRKRFEKKAEKEANEYFNMMFQ